MTDANRHRRARAVPVPQGNVPKATLALFGALAFAIAVGLQSMF